MWSLLQEFVPTLSKLELHSDSIRAQNLSVIAADFMSQFWRQTHPLRHFNTSVPDTRCYEIIEQRDTRGILLGFNSSMLSLMLRQDTVARCGRHQGQMRQYSLVVLRYRRALICVTYGWDEIRSSHDRCVGCWCLYFAG